MNLLYGLVAALLPAPCPAPAPALREYSVDYGHTIVEFGIKFAYSRVKGRFTQGKGTILYDDAAPANSSVTLVMEAKSIDTGWPHRDEHLRTSDFFDVEKFPTIAFQSRKVWQSNERWMAEGDLTMHGVTKRITMPFRFTQVPIRSPESRWMVMNIAGEVRLARADFGITGGSTYNSWFTKARAATMGDSVDVSFEVEGYSPDAASQRSARINAELARIDTNGIAAYVVKLRDLQKSKSAQELAPYLVGLDLLVRALIGSCRVPEAVTLSNAVTELFPESHYAHLGHGFVVGLAGDKRAAASEFANAKALFRPPVRDPNEKFPQDDDQWWYLDQLARTALEWSYAAEAVPLARTLTELYPQTARAFTTYGQTLAATGDARGAATAYEKALQVDPNEPRALEWRRRLK